MRLTLFLLLSLTTTFAAEKKYTFRDFAPTRYIDGPRLTPAMQKDKVKLRCGEEAKFIGQELGEDREEEQQ